MQGIVTKYLNRIVVIATAVAALAAGLLPVVADLDVTSTAGVIAGLLGVVTVVDRWLKGWQAYEAAGYSADLQRHQLELIQQEQRDAAARSRVTRLPR